MTEVILRKWWGRIRTTDRDTYLRYVLETGGSDYSATPGNLGYQILARDHGDGTTTIMALSWWESMDAIRAFAGSDPEKAHYYDEDDRFLIERPELVEHHAVVAGQAPKP